MNISINNLEITGATLLSVKEAEQVPKKDRAIGDWWWLCSPGDYTYSAAYVYDDGSVHSHGNGVNDYSYAIRPALQISLECSDLNVGDIFSIGKYQFKIISETRALCTEIIGRCAFREDWKTDDSNDYEMSDAKKYVDSWFDELSKKNQ